MVPHYSILPPKLKQEIPKGSLLLEAFNQFPYKDTAVIIIGPYKTILSNKIAKAANTKSVNKWYKQGVIITSPKIPLNNKHDNHYWEQVLTDYIKYIDKNVRYKVYMLWGEEAGQFRQVIDYKHNLIITAPAPSSPQFNDGDMFNTANDYLGRKGRTEIVW